jgi:hypothetical protein
VTSKWAERARSSPYYPALSHPVFRKVLPGTAASALGDGMSAVAIAWLAIELAPPGHRGLWVGAAVAAYSLPGAVGAVALRRWLVGRHGAGQYTLIADLLPAGQRVAGNSVFGLADQVSLMIGPALAGVVTALAGPALVIVLDATSWLILAVSYARIAPLATRLAQPAGPPAPDATPAATAGAWATIRSSPVLPGLLALTFVFYLLYGPIEVALPVHVATNLHGSAALLGTIWAIFGVGAVVGELSAPFLRRWPVWPVMTGIVLGWGLALVPFGLPTPLWAGLAAFTAGAVIWGPWMSLSMGVFQDSTPPGALAQVLAARSSLLILAAPIGIALGGPLVAALGARGTLLVSALATIALGLVTVAALLLARRAG